MSTQRRADPAVSIVVVGFLSFLLELAIAIVLLHSCVGVWPWE